MSRLHKNKLYLSKGDWALDAVQKEMKEGMEMLNNVENPLISLFGSTKPLPGEEDYEHCKRLATALGKEGYGVITGAGPGFMHAANTGATNAGTASLGVDAQLLPHETITEEIYTKKLSVKFFFVRRFLMSIKSEALIFYPGRYGTLDELFEFAMLMINEIVDRVPLICVNSKHWNGLINWLKENPSGNKHFGYKQEWLDYITICDDIEEIVNIVKKGKNDLY